MNRCFLAVSIAVTVGAATTAVASTILGPRGTFRANILNDLSYSPEKACYKPLRPYSQDRWAWSQYQSDGEIYLDCIKSAAESDIGYAREVIYEGYTKAAEDFLQEVENGY